MAQFLAGKLTVHEIEDDFAPHILFVGKLIIHSDCNSFHFPLNAGIA